MAYLKCLAVPDSLHIHVPCCETVPLTVHFLFLYICLGGKKKNNNMWSRYHKEIFVHTWSLKIHRHCRFLKNWQLVVFKKENSPCISNPLVISWYSNHMVAEQWGSFSITWIFLQKLGHVVKQWSLWLCIYSKGQGPCSSSMSSDRNSTM